MRCRLSSVIKRAESLSIDFWDVFSNLRPAIDFNDPFHRANTDQPAVCTKTKAPNWNFWKIAPSCWVKIKPPLFDEFNPR